jgi:hypothetical protein
LGIATTNRTVPCCIPEETKASTGSVVAVLTLAPWAKQQQIVPSLLIFIMPSEPTQVQQRDNSRTCLGSLGVATNRVVSSYCCNVLFFNNAQRAKARKAIVTVAVLGLALWLLQEQLRFLILNIIMPQEPRQIRIASLSKMFLRRHDTQHNETQHNDIQHNNK